MKHPSGFLFQSGLLFIMLFLLVCCKSNKTAERKEPLDLSAIDSSVLSQDNFFLYANGNWLKTVQIPASQPAWGAIFSLGDKSVMDMHSILDSVSKEHPPKGSIDQQAGDLYASAMDSAALEKLGTSPVKAELDRIAAIKDINA